MTGFRERDEALRARKPRVHAPPLGHGRPRILRAVEHQDRATHGPRVAHGIVAERPETPLDSAPEGQQLGGRKCGDAHASEAIADRAQGFIVKALDDHGFCVHGILGERPEDRHRPHGLPEEHDRNARCEHVAHFSDRGGDIG